MRVETGAKLIKDLIPAAVYFTQLYRMKGPGTGGRRGSLDES